MNIIEAAKALKEGRSVRRPYSISTWLHLYPNQHFVLSIVDLLADDYEVVE